MVQPKKNILNGIHNEPLALIGMNCQFPGLDLDIEDVDAFYEMLIKGQTPIKEVPKNRWDIDEYYDAARKKADKVISREGGFLNNPKLFDAEFFKISPAEAKQIDPQHRLFLEVSIRALNHANITLDSLKDSNTGVYCGISSQDYSQLNYKDNIIFNAYTSIGVANSAAAGRLSYFLNLRGPSMVLDTACSSSLSALYLAATALRTDQCHMAIVGGVHLSLCPENFIGATRSHMLSATGKCYSFDIKADGYARSEGCGVVIVKRLSDAIKDNNKVLAVIKSILINQDGERPSLFSPNIKAQINLHQAVLEQAQITASDIDYIEAHGTGSVIGDSIEFNAIRAVHQGQHKEHPLIIGALKSNLGHTLASSGIASLIKVICTFKNEIIPPNLHYSIPNESIIPESIPAILPINAAPFIKQKNKKRYAQVSNYSFCGTNIAVVLEESPNVTLNVSIIDNDTVECFVLSAHSESSLKKMLENYTCFLPTSSASLKDICYTLINCRDHYKFRCAILATDKKTLLKKIESEDYVLKKVSIQKEVIKIKNDAHKIYDAYLSGAKIRLDINEDQYNKVDLPLYYFDRKAYWHEPRKRNQQPSINILNIEPIAIIGMSCRFPKAANIDEFLSLLQRGESGMSDIPLDRWDNDKYYDADINALGRLYLKQLGLIDNVRNFDAEFFNISPREAKFMSPQLRVFMEVSYHALENANLSLDSIKGSNTGVFVGCGTNEYPALLMKQGLGVDDLNIYYSTGNVLNALAGRVAYAFDFHGPIQAIDTACSSSMTAIHNACLSLQSGDCAMALAGGVNILLIPESNITLSKAKMLSPDSRCKTFSEDADGYARSEGCGVIILKRLSTAINDKDNILAVIKGSSSNSNGKSAGFTVPNGMAQESLIRSALAKAKLTPADIDYIETHGTGTPLADPIEVNTLTKIFSEYHSKDKPLYISSVKTNIGHCESASGVASIIKTVLSLQTQTLFKHLNFKKLNSEIQLKNTIIPLSTMSWEKDHDLRSAGVSSFGFSGSNAHVILQQAPSRIKESRELPHMSLLVLSAKSKKALELLLSSYHNYLSNTLDQFADIAYTAATSRSHFLFRVAIKASSAKQAAVAIEKNEYTIYSIKKEIKSDEPRFNLNELQVAYENGFVINWLEFYRSLNTAFEKVTLPLYEFVREEYFFGDKDILKDAPIPKDYGFQLQWVRQPCDQSNRKIQAKTWLLTGDINLQSSFIAQGLHIVLEEDNYSLDNLDGIIFSARLDQTSSVDIETNIDLQKRTIKKLISLVKEPTHEGIELQLIVLTSNGIAELSVDELSISHSPLIGFCKTLVLELPQYSTILIDIDKALDSDYVTQQVLEEIKYNHGANYEHMVAYRDRKRLVTRLKNTPLIDNKRSLAGNGRYLITGGCGGLGLVSAQALLSAGAKEIILVSRTIDKPELKSAIKKIQSFYPNRTIRIVSLDVTDKKNLRQLLLDLNTDGLLKGIIHAAGAAIKTPLIEHQDKDIDYLFSAKVQGGWYLHELSQDCALDFFIVYSSIASVFGSNKESVYSATNSFLDALIAERHRLGLVGTSIQWGPWGDVGLAQNMSRNQHLKQAFINNQQGQALIKTLINGQLNYATIISPEYLKFMLDFVPKPLPAFYKFLAADLEGGAPVNKNLSSWLDDYIEIDEDKKLNICKEMLKDICKKILELSETEDLDEDEGFFEIGFDSLMITEMANELKKRLAPSMRITVNIGFDYPSIGKLAKYIQSELDTVLISKKAQEVSALSVEDSIAIIGMSCSLPNAPDINAFEKLLEEGLNGIKDIPLERWDNRKYYDVNRNAPGKSYVKKLGLIENIKYFDAGFFGISPREAKMMEPQQRIFLECSYKALENANYHAETLSGSLTGVYTGVGPNEYFSQLEVSGFSNEELSTYSITGNVLNLIPGRVAYAFDFKGPSISIDTACSSSLVAIHYACQGLKNREIDYALAGGVNILLRPESNITLCKANALSADGQCKTFDAKADGYVRSEGCGVVFLKRLSDAVRDKDNILAVIKASAVNNDGKSAGLTVPNGNSQVEVMKKALAQTDLVPSDISYIEAHGTGTPLGDPIEAHAINKVYGHERSADNPLYLGTVKTNIGHLESASGVVGIIKTVISLQKSKIYKHLNFDTLNPNIIVQNMRIALKNTEWDTAKKLKCAGVNAFGFSGTNAHVILQEYPIPVTQGIKTSDTRHMLVLSAKSKNALDKLASRYQQYLETTEDNFSDICFTAATCREHYTYRLAVTATSAAEAAQLLQKKDVNRSSQPLHPDYLQGDHIDWTLHYKNYGDDFIKVTLPNYTFDRSEFWPDKKRDNSNQRDMIHPLLGQMLSMPGNEYLFSQQLDLENLSYIKQHSVFEKMIFPATAYIESGLAAAKFIFKRNVFRIEQFIIERPLSPEQDQEFQVQIKPKNEDQYKINIFAKHESKWQEFSGMEIHSIPELAPERVNIDTLKSFFSDKMDLSFIYEHFKKRSLFYGEEFQVLQEGYVTADSILSKVVLTKKSQASGYYFHPVLLDGAMQSILLLSKNSAANTTYVPYAFSSMTTFQEAPRSIWVYVTNCEIEDKKELCVDIKIYDNSGLLIGSIDALKFRVVTRSNFISYESTLQNLYHIKWRMLDLKLPLQTELPELVVISKDEAKTKKVLGSLRYQHVNDPRKLETIENKNIIFLYEQEQFNELFHFCKRMFQASPKSFILVTENAYAMNSNDPVNPYHTMASAFWKSFKNELQYDKIYTVDLDTTSTLLNALDYIYHSKSAENQIAIRDSIYIPRLKKKHLPISMLQQETLFDSNASYLIVGGTGGLGKILIEYLICRGVKHLIIISRSECSRDIKVLIEQAKEKKVSLQHYAADASNFQQMEKIVLQLEFRLKGVFHLAGIVQDSLMINLSDEDMSQVLSAKMDSALILHQLTKHFSLDMFVLFSSSASCLGARGQSNYVAANGFLDGLAHCRHQQNLPAISINWGPFHATGMTEKLTEGLQQHGFVPLAKSSIDILDVLLGSNIAQISPCPIDWNIYFKHELKQAWLSDLVKTKPLVNQHFLNSLRQHTKEERLELLNQALCDIAADVLALDSVDFISKDDDLFSLGLDSLMAIEIRHRIYDKLNCSNLSLSIEYFINHPKVNKIAQGIVDELDAIFEDQPIIQGLEHSFIEEVPLCDFQYLFWAINKIDGNFNIGMQLQLHGKLNQDYLFESFDFIVKQNNTFWISIDKSAPIQRLKKQGQFKLIYKDISLNNELNVLEKEFSKNMRSTIPLTEQPLIRVYLYKINNNLHELHLVIPHIIVDDISCEIVFSQFKKYYEALTLGKKLVDQSEKESYFNFVIQNNHHYEKNLTEKIEFWRAYNKTFSLLNFGPTNHLVNTGKQPKYLFHYPSASQYMDQFINWHKTKNINVSTGLIAVCQIIFQKITGQNKIPIILIHSGREGSQYKSTVGLFSEYKRINITLNEEYKFIDCIHSIEAQLLKTAPYQKCSHFIKAEGLNGPRLSFAQYCVVIWKKFYVTKSFKESRLNTIISDYYLEYLSKLILIGKKISIKHKLNKLFKLNIPLLKPEGLRIIISITPSFFSKEKKQERSFANLEYSFPSHFGCMDRPIGNQTLWIYFSKNQQGEHQLSINGPLTTDCKDQIAKDFNKIISNFLANSEDSIAELIL